MVDSEPFITPPPETVTFTVQCEWNVEPDSESLPTLSFEWPEIFGKKEKPQQINPNTTSSFTTTTAKKIDDKFMNNILTNSFTFIINFLASEPKKHRHHHSSKSKSSSKPKDETKHHHSSKSTKKSNSNLFLQLDGHVFLLPETLQHTVEIKHSGFMNFKFTVSIGSPLLNDYFLKRFAPGFLHIQKVENLKRGCFIECNDKQIISNNGEINTVIVFSPREQNEVVFKVYESQTKEREWVGHGLVEMPEHRRTKNAEIGTGTYIFLPKRRRKVTINTTQIVVETLDPAEVYGTPTVPDSIREDKQRNEPPNSQYYRMIISLIKSAEGIKSARDLGAILEEINKNYGTFKRAIASTYDVITGFHVETPNEHLWVLECRAKEPMKSTIRISEFLEKLPANVNIVFDSSLSFEFPRLYYQLGSLIQDVMIPISISDLIRVDGLYKRNTQFAPLFTVSQKLFDLFSSKDCVSNEQFPTVKEIGIIVRNAADLYTAPINYTFEVHPPMEPQGEKERSFRRSFSVSKTTKPVLASTKSLTCHEDFKIEKKEKPGAVIVKPSKSSALSMTLSRRSISVSDHIEISANTTMLRNAAKSARVLADWRSTERRSPRNPRRQNKTLNIV